MASPRVLTLSFELHVPEGLKANIRTPRLDTAIAVISTAVQTLVPIHFPWADRITMRSEWAYRWSEQEETVQLPATTQNTVTPDGDQDAAVGSSEYAEPQP